VLDDCAASKDVKGQTGELVKLGFSARHSGISVWVLTQQLSSIAKPFRENVAVIVLFYTPSAKTTKAIFEEYAGELTQDKLRQMIARLKERKFAPFDLFASPPVWNTIEGRQHLGINGKQKVRRSGAHLWMERNGAGVLVLYQHGSSRNEQVE